MKNFLIPIFALWLSALSGSTSFASEGAPIGAAEVDPPVILSSASNRALIVKWQTSIPGIVASPVEQHRLAANSRDDVLQNANFWFAKDGSVGNARNALNQIEVWVYDGARPDVLLSTFKTFRLLFPADLKQDDKKVILEIDISANLGIDVRLDTFR